MDNQLSSVCRLLGLNFNDSQLAEALNPFRIGDLLDEGVMAVVFEAINAEDGTQVIVKLPSPEEYLLEPDFPTRVRTLQYESDWLEQARHHAIKGVVRVIANRTNERFPFLVLEKLGPSLGTTIEANGREILLEDCLVMLRDIATVLQRLHGCELYHCDVKPDNILQDRQGWTLIDPAPVNNNTIEYLDERVPAGPRRDILALGRTFLAAYLGAENSFVIKDLEGCDIYDHPALLQLVKRMLRESRYAIPDARTVRRLASRILADEYGVSSPRYRMHE